MTGGILEDTCTTAVAICAGQFVVWMSSAVAFGCLRVVNMCVCAVAICAGMLRRLAWAFAHGGTSPFAEVHKTPPAPQHTHEAPLDPACHRPASQKLHKTVNR